LEQTCPALEVELPFYPYSSAYSSITKGKDKLILAQQVKNFTHYVELEGSLQFSKQAASAPSPDSDKPNPHYAL
jgi:hypothetical protein